MQSLVLSLFPGIGLLDMAFEQEGFVVVRGPDVIWGGDVRAFHPPAGKFDGIIGGPPCQMFSSLARLVEANGHKTRFGNLIPEFERCVRAAQPAWYLMENVLAAPEPMIEGYGMKAFMLDNSLLAAGDDGFGQEQRRVRKLCFGMRGVAIPPSLMRWIDLAVFVLPDPAVAVTSTDGGVRPSEQKTRRNPVISAPAPTGDGFQHTEEGRARKKAAKQLSEPVTTHDRGSTRTLHETIHSGHGTPPGSATRAKAVSSNNGGRGKQRQASGAGNNGRGRYKLADACRLQGLPEDFLSDAPFTAEGKLKAVANGVPIPMGRALARAIKEAIRELSV